MRKLKSETIFELFEVSPDPTAVMGAKGKLICSYPGPAIAVPNTIVDDPSFIAELANFLVHMDQESYRQLWNIMLSDERHINHLYCSS